MILHRNFKIFLLLNEKRLVVLVHELKILVIFICCWLFDIIIYSKGGGQTLWQPKFQRLLIK